MKKSDEQVVLTRSGYERLREELSQLRTSGRQEVAKELEFARGLGDLSENAEYQAAKDKQSQIEGRIMELENLLSKVNVIDEENLDTNRVAIGLTVTLEDLSNGKIYTYSLVGSEELSSASNEEGPQKISQKSPVGQAILGHIAGEEVSVKIPRGMRKLKIVSIGR